MSKYDVKFPCGHTEEKQLFGRQDERYRTIERWERDGECSDCYRARMRRSGEAADAEAKALGLPDLRGSEKQVAWASSIRARFLSELEGKMGQAPSAKDREDVEDLRDALIERRTSARWWIDHGQSSTFTLLLEQRDGVGSGF